MPNLNNEGVFGISKGQRTHPKTSLHMIGVMVGMQDFSSLCVNHLLLQDVIVDMEKGKATSSASIWRQINLHFILFVSGTAFTIWLTNVGQPMPRLPWMMFAYLEAAWLCLTCFSTNHINSTYIVMRGPLRILISSTYIRL